MKQPKHHFHLESKKNEDGTQLIYLNFSYGFKLFNPSTRKERYIPLRISSQYSILKDYWDDKPNYRANKKYVAKHGKDLNNNLENIEQTVYKQLLIYRNEHEKNPSPSELKKIVLEKLNRIQKINKDMVIADFIDKVINERKKLPPSSKLFWRQSTISQYANLKAHLENYESSTKQIITFSTLTELKYWEFFDSINKKNEENKGRPIKHNTISKICKHFRVILGIATKQNIEIGFNWHLLEYKIHEVQTENNIALEEEQLLAILNTDVTHSKEFINARNYLLISCLTALRISDMMELHNCEPRFYTVNNIKFNGVETKIRKANGVTNELRVIIPIPQILKTLITENHNKFPKFPSESVLRLQIKKYLAFLEFKNKVQFKEWYYGEQNARIEEHEVHEVFSPHSCRYTFITCMSKLGVPESVVKNITHPTLKARNILDGYNLSTMEQNAFSLYNALNNKNSEVFKF